MVAIKRPFVLIAEEDPDLRLIYSEALAKTEIQVDYEFVGSGDELLGYLKDAARRRPCIILTDIRLPIDSHVLELIMEDDNVRGIPLIVITSEDEEEETRKAYATCANSYIMKPTDFQSWVRTLNRIFSYWFETVKLATW
jgi:two-component system response regulator